MGKLSSEEVEKVAKLARLQLTKKEVEKFKGQLSAVVTFVEELNEVDTKDTEPTNQTTGLVNVSREDEATSSESLSQTEALSGTSKFHNGYFVVERLIDDE